MPAQQPSLPQALTTLALVTAAVLFVVNLVQMRDRQDWVARVVVVTGPIHANDRVDASRLEYDVRRTVKSPRPLSSIAQAEGRFLTRHAEKRCGSSCTELVLEPADVASRPEIGETSEVLKATLAQPWTLTDIRLGDCVLVTLHGSGSSAGTAAPSNETVVPDARAGAAAPVAQPPPDPAPDKEFKTQPVTVLALGPANATPGIVYVTPPAALDAARLDLMRAGTLHVTSITVLKSCQ